MQRIMFYGAATMVQKDAFGQEIFSQTVHNRVVDTGEEFLLDQVFQDTVTSADDVQIGSICISDAVTPVIAETAADFDFDGVGSNQDKDDDNDGILDENDSMPWDYN